MIDMRIKKQVHLDLKYSEGKIALYYAHKNDHLECFKPLIMGGANLFVPLSQNNESLYLMIFKFRHQPLTTVGR